MAKVGLDAPLVATETGAPAKGALVGDAAFAEDDARYPDWHKWLSVSQQVALTYVIYGTFAVWLVGYVICKADSSLDEKYFGYLMLLPIINYLFAVVLVVGMVSKLTKSTKAGLFSVGLLYSLIHLSPRLAVPAFGGLIGPFGIYVNLVVIFDDGVVGWENFSVPGYMSCVAPLIACVNMLFFKAWCGGYLPKIVYWLFFMLLMVATTIKEWKKATADRDTSCLDYKVSIPVAHRLIAFRVAVLTMALGVGMTSSQEQLLGLLRDDVWACTPLSW